MVGRSCSGQISSTCRYGHVSRPPNPQGIGENLTSAKRKTESFWCASFLPLSFERLSYFCSAQNGFPLLSGLEQPTLLFTTRISFRIASALEGGMGVVSPYRSELVVLVQFDLPNRGGRHGIRDKCSYLYSKLTI